MRYSTHPWDDYQSPEAYTQPWSRWEAQLIQDALDSNREPSADIQLHRSPGLNDPRPARDLAFMNAGARRAPSIFDVLGETRLPSNRIDDFSGSPGGYAGSIRNSLGGV